MKRNEFITIESSRGRIFNVLTALLCQPEESPDSRKKALEVLEEEFTKLNKEAYELANGLLKEIEKFGYQDLLLEYTKLFLGPFKVLAPPYSSIYFGRKQLVSEETMWVSDFYQKAGLKFDKELKDLPDHIAVEMEFMYFLVFNELKALEDDNSEKAKEFFAFQTDFFNKHFKLWIPKFCDQIEKQSENSYYLQLAKCIKFFIVNVPIPEFKD
jgi:putative dimethyl sulfoxide reductase chaperone